MRVDLDKESVHLQSSATESVYLFYLFLQQKPFVCGMNDGWADGRIDVILVHSRTGEGKEGENCNEIIRSA